MPADRAAAVAPVATRYAVAVTPAMAALVDRADPADPIARQFVPGTAELTVTADENADPIGDGAHQVTPGLIHRYRDRVLLKLTDVCAVYCRFCFRREMVGHGAGGMSRAELDAALGYIRARPEIWEVVVSGGDPLVVSPRRLAAVTAALAAIDHVKVLRFHTRAPVVAPEKVTGDLVAALRAPGKATWVAVHANHPRELTPAARAALARLFSAGVHLVSQTVLLAGVNDDADTLAALMRAFVESGVKPLLPAPCGPCPRHRPFPDNPGKGPGADEGAARPPLGPCPADLRPRRPGRVRQGPGRPELCDHARGRLLCGGHLGRNARLP